jgi:hypothetical protein
MNQLHASVTTGTRRKAALLGILSVISLMVILAGACEFTPRVLCEGHIRLRYISGERYVVCLIDSRGDTIEVATDRDTYMYYPDIYYHAIATRDSILGRRRGDTLKLNRIQ